MDYKISGFHVPPNSPDAEVWTLANAVIEADTTRLCFHMPSRLLSEWLAGWYSIRHMRPGP